MGKNGCRKTMLKIRKIRKTLKKVSKSGVVLFLRTMLKLFFSILF